MRGEGETADGRSDPIEDPGSPQIVGSPAGIDKPQLRPIAGFERKRLPEPGREGSGDRPPRAISTAPSVSHLKRSGALARHSLANLIPRPLLRAEELEVKLRLRDPSPPEVSEHAAHER